MPMVVLHTHPRVGAVSAALAVVVLAVCAVNVGAQGSASALLFDPRFDIPTQAPKPKPMTSEQQERMNTFSVWLGNHGVVTYGGLSVGPSRGGLEVFTSTGTNPRELLFTIPRDVAMRVDSKYSDFRHKFAEDMRPGGSLVASTSDRTDLLQLIAMLMYECTAKKNSFWAPYCLTIPAPGSFSYLPPYDSQRESELYALSGTLQHYLSSPNRIRGLAQDFGVPFAMSHPEVFGFYSKGALEAGFRWAADIIITRAYEGRREGDVAALIPLSDMLNHEIGSDSLKWDEEPSYKTKQDAIIAAGGTPTPDQLPPIRHYGQVSNSTVAPGGAVTASYGEHLSDAHLLAHYGFVPRNVAAGHAIVLTISLRAGSASALRELSAAGKTSATGQVTVHFCTLADTDVIVDSMLIVHRVGNLRREVTAADVAAASQGILSLHNEYNSIKVLRHDLLTLKASLAEQYGSTWGKLLEQFPGPVTDNERNILHVMRGELRALDVIVTNLEGRWTELLWAAGGPGRSL